MEMGKTILEKMTFYDIVTLIVPGALVCCAWDWSIFSNLDKIWWASYVAQFGLVLLVGLLIKSVNLIWGGWWFRNNTKILLKTSNDETNHFKETLCNLFCGPLLYIISPISGLIHRLLGKHDEGLLRRYYDEYNKAYYNAYSGKRIELLESQVAFLQNWSWALIICMVGKIGKLYEWGWCGKYNWGVDWWILALGIYACIVAMFILQKKVYQVVWDNIDSPDSEQNESNPKRIDKKQENPSNKEHLLTIFFWGSTIVILLMLIGFILRVGMNSQLSCKGSDWADFSTYIGTFGTMLFTAVYAYSFIKLQGTINISNNVQETKNQLDKEKEEERKIRRNFLIYLASVENAVNTGLNFVTGIKLPPKTERLPDDLYRELMDILDNIQQYIDNLSSYHDEGSLKIMSAKSSEQILLLIREMNKNITRGLDDTRDWNKGLCSKSNAHKMIKDDLQKTFNLAKNIEFVIASTILEH